jgi:hypothetical protein
MIASSVVDAMTLRIASALGSTEIVPKKQFARNIQPKLREAVRAAAAVNGIEEAACEELVESLAGLFRRSFKARLRTAVSTLGIPLDDDEIIQIVRSRNAVVHEITIRDQPLHSAVAYFESVGSRRAMGFQDLQVVLWATYCLLIRLIGYGGKLPNWRDIPMYGGASLGY